jgi:hypothetical protein
LDISGGQPDDDFAELKPLQRGDKNDVDRASDEQAGGEGTAAEPAPQRPVEHENFGAPEHRAHQYSID